MDEENLKNIGGDIKILQIQKELIDSKNWDDKTHLEKKYEMHESNFYSSISEMCISLGLFNRTYPNKNGVYAITFPNGSKKNFDISRDYNNQKGIDVPVGIMSCPFARRVLHASMRVTPSFREPDPPGQMKSGTILVKPSADNRS